MKTYEQIIAGVLAREAGRVAAREGKKMDANPHPEESDLHWDWLDAWCVEESAKRDRQSRQNAESSRDAERPET